MITVYQPEPNYVHKYLRHQNFIDDSNSGDFNEAYDDEEDNDEMKRNKGYRI